MNDEEDFWVDDDDDDDNNKKDKDMKDNGKKIIYKNIKRNIGVKK